MSTNENIRVWDLPTRLFHWSMVALLALVWVSSDLVGFHASLSYALLALFFFRLVWGVIGTRHALFQDFVKSPSEVMTYAEKLSALRPPHSVGHNPLGGWMILLLLFFLFLSIFSGLFITKHGFVGPLADSAGGFGSLMGEMHEGVTGVFSFLIAIHIAAVFFDRLITGDNLVKAMFTGEKDASVAEGRDEAIPPFGLNEAIRGLAALALGGAVTWMIIA